LIGKVVKSTGIDERVLCPVNRQHQRWSQRALITRFNEELDVVVKHNKRDHMMIWAGVPEKCFVHIRLLEEIGSAGFTGFSSQLATVRFRDGFLSNEYRRLVVTGWGGLARPESGIRLVEHCPGCIHKRWTPLSDPSQLIDTSQWTGEDFFIVWPLPAWTFVTESVAEFLRSSKIKELHYQEIGTRHELHRA
jgi:hypothetical protein